MNIITESTMITDDQLEMFEGLRGLMPSWLHELILRYSDTELASHAYASCLTDYVYRTATITLSPLFFTLDEKRQKQVAIHEVCHIVLEPFLYTLKGYVKFEEDEEGNVVPKPVLDGLESSVEDLSWIMLDLMKKER